MRKLRIVSQTVFTLLFFLSFFFLNRQPFAYRVPAQWFLRLNPLTAITTALASRGIETVLLVMAAVVLAATVVFGRFFCGFICPLGAMIDFSDRFLTRKMRSRLRRPPRYLQRLKYVLLIALLSAAVFGFVVPWFMDPISLVTRLSAIIVYPLYKMATIALYPLLRAAGVTWIKSSWLKQPLFYGSFGAAALLAAVIAGGFWDKRFWCQYVCPSGALFGLLSRFAFFRRRTGGSCTSCKLCAARCPTRAIDPATPGATSTAECILCGECVTVREGCSSFSFGRMRGGAVTPPDIKRRHVIGGILGGLALVPAFKANAMSRRGADGRLIRPPGALKETDFLARCIACGQCMKACPTNAIQPCGFSDGLHRIYTPKIVPRIGGCEEKCFLCGHVCPTGALRRLTFEQKNFAKLGTAVIDRHRCLAWAQNRECLVCDEMCPYNAIRAHVVETTKGLFKVPVVYEDLCVGCGLCEHHCPVTDQAAIIVYSFGENRRNEGDYLNEWQRRTMLERRREPDSHLDLSVGSGAPSAMTEQNTAGPAAGSESKNAVSEGFF
jgi:MauM/NapG family ferredoxin protein